MRPISKMVRNTPPSGIRRFFDIVSQMDDVISLGVGEPDFITPWRTRESVISVLEQGKTDYTSLAKMQELGTKYDFKVSNYGPTSYTSNFGMLELRALIADYLEKSWQIKYRPQDQVLITVGVSEAMDLVMRAILDPGDEVLVPEPCYVSYKPSVVFAGGIPITLPTDASTKFRVTPEQVESAITGKTKAILISYPCNPTGATMPRDTLEDIVAIAKKHDLYIISDEIYDKLTYVDEHTCVPSLDGAYDRTILLNGFSKAYAMTGWRIGYAAGNSEVIEAMMKVHQYSMLCAPMIGQIAACEAIISGEEDSQDMIEQYAMRRRVIVKGLNSVGLDCVEPGGAFYAFPSIEKTGLSSEEFSERLLFEKNVAVVPGTAFGDCGEGYIRCSYATALDKIELAVEKIGQFVKKIKS